MRYALLFALLASPTCAWEFEAQPVCTIWHSTGTAEMRVTYDPSLALPYAIAVTRHKAAWAAAPVYSIRFEGPGGFEISTDRHLLSDDNKSVIAEDAGFGNVLRGLKQGVTATAILGQVTESVPLSGAPGAVAKFRDCTQPGIV